MTANLKYCGAIALLRKLVENGVCTQREAQKISARLAAQYGADIVISI